METLIEFVKLNYLFFSIISIVLMLALVGYIVERHRNKDVVIKSDQLLEEPVEETLD